MYVMYSAVAWGGAGGAWVPPIVWQARLIWSAAMLLMLLYGSLGLFRFARACFLFFYGFNKEITVKNYWKLMLSEGWKCYFKDLIF